LEKAEEIAVRVLDASVGHEVLSLRCLHGGVQEVDHLGNDDDRAGAVIEIQCVAPEGENLRLVRVVGEIRKELRCSSLERWRERFSVGHTERERARNPSPRTILGTFTGPHVGTLIDRAFVRSYLAPRQAETREYEQDQEPMEWHPPSREL